MSTWSEMLNQAAQSAVTKGKEVAEVSRLNLEISSLNQKINEVYARVGQYVLKKKLLEEDEIIAGYTAELKTLLESRRADREKIKELKAVKTCGNCGAPLEKDAAFCASCGARQE